MLSFSWLQNNKRLPELNTSGSELIKHWSLLHTRTNLHLVSCCICRAIDPIDGTVNFASGLDSFCVSVGVLRHATPLAGVVIEFVGGPAWQYRIYSASRNGGAFLNGARMSVSGVRDLADAVVVSRAFMKADVSVSFNHCHDPVHVKHVFTSAKFTSKAFVQHVSKATKTRSSMPT